MSMSKVIARAWADQAHKAKLLMIRLHHLCTEEGQP
jgi:hypothetical protein